MYRIILSEIRIFTVLSLITIITACSTATIVEEQPQLLPRVIPGNELIGKLHRQLPTGLHLSSSPTMELIKC